MAGSFEALGRACNVSGKAVKKWADAGRPPRTEYTGETEYAEAISELVGGRVSPDDLRPKLNPTSPM